MGPARLRRPSQAGFFCVGADLPASRVIASGASTAKQSPEIQGSHGTRENAWPRAMTSPANGASLPPSPPLRGTPLKCGDGFLLDKRLGAAFGGGRVGAVRRSDGPASRGPFLTVINDQEGFPYRAQENAKNAAQRRFIRFSADIRIPISTGYRQEGLSEIPPRRTPYRHKGFHSPPGSYQP